jgi:hypothetical protein
MAKEPDSVSKKIIEILAYPAPVDKTETKEEAQEAASEAEDLKDKLKEETGADMDS